MPRTSGTSHRAPCPDGAHHGPRRQRTRDHLSFGRQAGPAIDSRRPRPARARVLPAQARPFGPRPAGQFRHQRSSRLVAARLVHRGAHRGDHAGDLRLPPRAWNRRPAAHGEGHARVVGAPQRTALEVLAANEVDTIIQREGGVTPTPVISWAVLTYNRGRKAHLADGIVITPSHNPPEDGGFKYDPPNGGPAGVEVTGWIEERANQLLRSGNAGVKRVPLETAVRRSTTHEQDFVLSYVRDLQSVVDMGRIREAGLELGVDPLGGASLPYWEAISALHGISVAVVNRAIDPT